MRSLLATVLLFGLAILIVAPPKYEEAVTDTIMLSSTLHKQGYSLSERDCPSLVVLGLGFCPYDTKADVNLITLSSGKVAVVTNYDLVQQPIFNNRLMQAINQRHAVGEYGVGSWNCYGSITQFTRCRRDKTGYVDVEVWTYHNGVYVIRTS